MDMFCKCCSPPAEQAEVVVVPTAAVMRPADNPPQSPRIAEAAKLEAKEEALPEPEPKLPILSKAIKAPQFRESEDFTAVVVKGDRKLGMDINYHDNTTLLITRVNAGPAWEYNLKNKGNLLGPGDRVITINGESGDTQKMLGACKGVSELKMSVRRCEERTIKLEKRFPEQTLGMVFEPCDMMTLVVVGVDEGDSATAEYNRLGDTEFQLNKDCRIIGVNGVRDDAVQITAALEDAKSWELVVRQIWPSS